MVGDATIFPLSPRTLFSEFLEIHHRGLIADGDVDFRLGQGVVGDLIIAALAQPLPFEMILWVKVMHVAFVQDEIANSDVTGKEAFVTELHLGGLKDAEIWTGRAGGIHLLRKESVPI